MAKEESERVGNVEHKEYYYYQCQEVNCKIPADGPKPCKLAIPKDQGDPNPIFCIYSKKCKGVIWKAMSKEQYNMIPVMLVEYWDGSQYKVRKDKPGWEDLVETLNKEKGEKFLLRTPQKKQLDIMKKRKCSLVDIKEVEMTEADYLETLASVELGMIQLKQKNRGREPKEPENTIGIRP